MRIALVTAVLVSIALGGVGFFTLRAMRRALTRQMGQNLADQAQLLADSVNLFLQANTGELEELALSTIIQDAIVARNADYGQSTANEIARSIQELDRQWIDGPDDALLVRNILADDPAVNPAAHRLHRFVRSFPRHAEVFITDAHGATVAASGLLSDYDQSDEAWWQSARNGGDHVYISDPTYDESAEVTALLIAMAVIRQGDGAVIGVLRSTLNVDGLVDLVRQVRVGKTGYAMLINRSGSFRMVLAPQAAQDGGAELSPDLQETFLGPASGWVNARDEEGMDTLFGHAVVGLKHGAAPVATARRIEPAVGNLGWAVVVRQRATEALASAALVTRAGITAGMVGLCAACLVGIFMSRALTRPLVDLCTVAERVGGGELDIQIPEDGSGEVGLLIDSFRNMMSRLKEQNRRIDDAMQALRHQAAEVANGVEVLNASTDHILASASQLASGASETAAAVTEVSATMAEVRQAAEAAGQRTRQVADGARQAAEVSQAGSLATEKAGDGMQRIREQMESIAASMGKLGQQIETVSHITAVVDDLAQQSNLLAVNASIEAAQAGEQGKGFSVVAQEVKSLADQSRQATTRIRNILTEIQNAAVEATQATEQGYRVVEEGVGQSSQAGETIIALASSISESAQAAGQIAVSSRQQTVSVDQVASAMGNIRDASSQNADSARDLENAARSLKELSARLHGLVQLPRE